MRKQIRCRQTTRINENSKTTQQGVSVVRKGVGRHQGYRTMGGPLASRGPMIRTGNPRGPDGLSRGHGLQERLGPPGTIEMLVAPGAP
jgi:hypothetical protein